MKREQLSLYLVTDRSLAKERDIVRIVKEAVEGGVTIVQLREKNIDTREFVELGKRLKSLLSKYDIPLIINDRIDVALAVDADGVHIGQSDMPYDTARKLLGPNKIIGLSIETFEELEQANLLDVDYVAVSPIFSTSTKTDTASPWGIEGTREFVKRSKHPVVAIGGINKGNIAEVFETGVDGVAVVSAIVSADNPCQAAFELKKLCPNVADGEAKIQQTIGQWGEFGLIEKIRKNIKVPKGVTGIGDDCAILPQSDGMQTLVSCDMLVEDVHFLRNKTNPYDLGWKSAAVNISDIAAMGGKPVSTFLSLSLPSDVECDWMEMFIKGYSECCNRYDAPLLGGDTTSSKDRICINVTILGKCKEGEAKLRSSAETGDLICVTGNLGDSAGGLSIILENKNELNADEQFLIHRHFRPSPRVEEGVALAKCEGVHAMMDISDGIGSDLRHILKASGVSAEIDCDKVPISPALKAVLPQYAEFLAIEGGEDYELLFTITPEAEKNLKINHSVIGRIVSKQEKEIVWKGSDMDFSGFKHF